MIMDNRLKAKAIIDNECINCGDGKRSRHRIRRLFHSQLVDMEALLVDGRSLNVIGDCRKKAHLGFLALIFLR